MEKLYDNRPIGVFDSGVGGLTVARSIRRSIPDEDIIYFGDTARVPYGNKSKDTIIRFAHEIVNFMIAKKVKMVVVACNTASSLSLQALKKTYDIPVIGVIVPGVKEAVKVSKNKRIGVIGTHSTVSSGAYVKELKKVSSRYRIFQGCCPLFVPLVENKMINDPVTFEMAGRYLKTFREKDIDTLILGCTHYPILKSVIGKVMKDVKLVDSSFAVAREVDSILRDKGLSAYGRKRSGKIKCFVSDNVEAFRNVASIFFKENLDIKKVIL
ncbi:MAG: glutamate racemase [Candidatus Omnitrophica bacterium]|nr:glutamate racemase [Candidatus Omnitrophota bacterium]